MVLSGFEFETRTAKTEAAKLEPQNSKELYYVQYFYVVTDTTVTFWYQEAFTTF